MKSLLEVLQNIQPINEASGFVFTIDDTNPLSDIRDKVESMSKEDYINAVLSMAGKKADRQDFIDLVKKATDIWFDKLGHNLIDIPFAFNQNGHVKLRMTVASQMNYVHKEVVIPGVVVGDGTISLGPKITTADQESATVVCWNRMTKAARSKTDGFDINNKQDVMDLVASVGISLTEDWVKSCQLQCVAIFEFLRKQGIKDVRNFQASRYGEGEVGKMYARFVKEYAAAAEQSKWDDGYSGTISKDNYDPSDIILYNDRVKSAAGALSNCESMVSRGWEMARDTYKRCFLSGRVMGISLKKVHDPCKVEFFNINKGGAVVSISSIDEIQFSKSRKSGEDSGCRVFVTGKFKFDGISDPENSDEFDTINESKLVIELRSFGDIGMDVKQVHNNKPGIALGKVPVRFWRRDLGTQSKNVRECAEIFAEFANNSSNKSKLENLIKEGIKAGPWCLPFVLIH